MVEIESFPGGGFSSNVFLVQSERTFLVDTGMIDPKRIYDHIDSEELDIDRIILTHCHYDHSANAGKISDGLDIPIYAHEKAAEVLREGDENMILSKDFGDDFQALEVEEIERETYAGFLIIHTPGHTAGSISLYHGGEKILLSGDLVFPGGGVGRTDLPTGNMSTLEGSLEKITEFDVESLYPGHGNVVERGGNDHIQLSLKNLSML